MLTASIVKALQVMHALRGMRLMAGVRAGPRAGCRAVSVRQPAGLARTCWEPGQTVVRHCKSCYEP